MKLSATIVAALLSVALPSSSSAQDPRIAVYVGSGATQQKASKEHLADSVKDLRSALANHSTIRVVDSPVDAEIVLRVQGRQWRESPNGSQSWGSNDSLGGHGTATTYATWAWLKVDLQAGTFTDTWNVAGKSWRGSANRVSNQVADWIKANRRGRHRDEVARRLTTDGTSD